MRESGWTLPSNRCGRTSATKRTPCSFGLSQNEKRNRELGNLSESDAMSRWLDFKACLDQTSSHRPAK
jgi:hypothetical protein